MATTHIMSDIKLMRDQVGPLTAQAAVWHPVLLALKFTGAIAQREPIHSIDLTGEQTILGLTENQLAVEQNFAQRHIGFFGIQAGADINKQAIFFFYFIDM
ncbi:Uncharacterised protein [Salmonella enterica subsp. enterica serovar Typhi]|nr:Uncharacterised protein [Salmonella enterica subsp. enterica serovar Typhi]CGZ39854.1 Uncharacterised protein [Salmonella enterica subsp. enterica serovar Typhi]CQV32519.1 Uncharacterised protein [Salmonella enterica subsp. enterica serovar Typhi]CXB75544.1 Uncharacterised protein [Salmonella enterica subsp. enterica serovar Typhi]CXC02026.1 Uncharacterised protein [Salmonella enterica subsp. enterica serovar Typhi]